MNLNMKKLLVKYNGLLVGTLVDTNNGISFQYDENWIKEGFSISPLSLPLTDKVYIQTKQANEGLFGVFHDSLPGGWGRMTMVKKFRKKGIEYEDLPILTRLALTNNLSLGALSYEPQELNNEENDLFCTLDEIAKNINLIYDDKGNPDFFDEIISLSTQTQGSRPKIYVNIDNEEWIIKFKSNLDTKNIGKQEYEANLLAKRCSIEINEPRLFESKKCNGYFGTKRFDRIDGKRVHMVYLSSLLETSYRFPNLDYIHLIKVCQRICKDKEDALEAYRRMCFNVFYGNKDDHGNNFAFIYDESIGGYRLSPFYDITKTPYLSEHNMTINGNPNPSEADLIEVAKQTELPLIDCKNIILSLKYTLKK